MHRLPCIPVFFYAMAFSFTLLVFHLTANSVVQCKFWEIFKNKLNQLIKEHVPHKIAKVKDSLPWINTETKKLIRKRYRLYKKMKKNGNLDTKKKFKKIKHHIQTLLRQSYWQYIEDVVTPKETEGTFNSMKMFWTYIKHKKNLSSRNLIIKTRWQINH